MDNSAPLKRLCSLVAISVCLCSTVRGGSDSWTGGTNTSWATGNNWSTGVVPTNDLVTDIAVFDAMSYVNQPNAGTVSVSGIQVGDGTTLTAPLTLSGTNLSLGTQGVTVSQNSGAVTINTELTLGATQTWTNGSSNPVTVAGQVSGSGALTIGSGTWVFTNTTNNNSGGITINGGTLQLGNATNVPSNGNITIGSSGRLYLNYATGSEPTLSSFSGAGTLELNSAQPINGTAFWGTVDDTGFTAGFTGTLQIDVGRIDLGAPGCGGLTNVIIGNGAQFLAYDMTSNTETFSENFTLAGYGWGESGYQYGALRSSQLTAIYTGNISLAGSTGIFQQLYSSGTTSLNGVVSGASNASLQLLGQVNLNGANTYSGGTIIIGGTITASGSSALGASTGSLTINNSVSTAVLNLSTTAPTTVGTLTGTGGTTINTANNELFTVNETSSGTYGGVIAGSGGFCLGSSSSSTLTLSGANTYTGATTINAGTLNVTGSLATGSAVSVNGGGTLTGTGVVNGSVTLAAGTTSTTQGTLMANSGTPLTVGTLTAGGTGTNSSNLVFGLGNATTNALLDNGTLTIGAGGINLSGVNQHILGNTTYTLATFSGGTYNGNALTNGTGMSVDGITLSATPFGTVSSSLTLTTGATDTLTITTGNLFATPATAYWNGSLGSTWNATSGAYGNFTTDAAGTSPILAFPGASTDVYFDATGATNLTNTLGLNFDIKGITFLANDAGGNPILAVNIGGTNSLQIEGDGITNANTHGVTLGMSTLTPNISQTWTNNAGAGTLNINSLITGTATTGNTTTLTLSDNSSNPINLSNIISDGVSGGHLALTINGSATGSVVLSGNNTYSGGTIVSAGKVVDENNSSAFGYGPISIASGATVQVDDSSNIILNSTTFTGTGTLLKTGSGTLTFGAGSVTVNVNLSAGALIDVEGGALESSSYGKGYWTNNQASLNIGSGSIFEIKENEVYVDALTGSGSLTQNYLGPGITVGVANGSGTFSGVIGGGGSTLAFTKVGTGTEILSGSNTYTGGTTVSAGTLEAENNGSALGFGTISIASGATVQFDNASTIGPNSGTTFTGTGTLLKTGTGDLIFGYNGQTVNVNLGSGALIDVEGGYLESSSGGNGYWTNNQASLNIGSAGTFELKEHQVYVDALTGSGSLTQTFSGPGITVGVANGSGTFSGVIGGGGSTLAFTKVGTGTEILSGSNTYTGGTTVSAGTLEAENNGSAFGYGTISIASGATVQVDDNSNIILNSTTFTGTGTLLKTGSGTLTFGAGSVTVNTNLGAGALIDVEGGALVSSSFGKGYWTNNLASLNIGSAGTFEIKENQVYVDALTGSGNLTQNYAGPGINVGVANGSGTFSGVIGGGGSTLNFTKTGTGKETLTGTNTYTGSTTVNGGTLQISGGGSIHNTSAVTVNTGGSLLFGTTTSTPTSSPVTLNSGTLGFVGSSGGNSVTMGALTLSSSSTLDFGSGRSGSSNNTFTFASLASLAGGVTLTVSDYLTNGTYALGGTSDGGSLNQDRLLLTSEYGSSLGTQLSQIIFYNNSGQQIGYGEEVAFGGQYEIVPISTPEPSTFFVAFLLLIPCMRKQNWPFVFVRIRAHMGQ